MRWPTNADTACNTSPHQCTCYIADDDPYSNIRRTRSYSGSNIGTTAHHDTSTNTGASANPEPGYDPCTRCTNH